MSLINAIYTPTGIVLSGDSRTTGTVLQQVPNPQAPNQQINVQTNIVLSDAAEKVFLLFGKFGVGTFGDALVSNLPIAHYIKQFESDNAATPPADTSALATSLLAYFRSLNPVPNCHFIVAGYDLGVPSVALVDAQHNTSQRVNIAAPNNDIQYGIVRGGDTAVVDRLLSQPQFNPPFQVMNLQDAVDYSRHLIRSTIDQVRFEPRFPTVGGTIDTLIITAKEAKFLAHKSLIVSI